MTHRPWSVLTCLLIAGVIALLAVAPARPALSASKTNSRRTPTPTPTATSLPNAATYVHAYANIVSGTQRDVTPEEVQVTSDGGYILAGDGPLLLSDEAPIVPWVAKIDAGGNLVWQHFYYQIYQPTGRPLSEYFAASSVTPGGGSLSLGWTENYATLKGELFAVKTDSAGLAGSCSDEHPATPLTAIDPMVTAFSPILPVQTAITPGSASPSGISATSIGVQADC